MAAIAAERGCTPFDVVCDVALDDRLETRFSVTFANDEEDGVTLLIQSDGCIMGLSDAGAHVGQICDAVMPTDFLANWVRDRQVMPLETRHPQADRRARRRPRHRPRLPASGSAR